MDIDEEPVLTAYRTNGLVWAAFAIYADGTEEPLDIFGTERDMLVHATGTLPHRIEYRPQELGCESSEEETAIIPRLAVLYDESTGRERPETEGRGATAE